MAKFHSIYALNLLSLFPLLPPPPDISTHILLWLTLLRLGEKKPRFFLFLSSLPSLHFTSFFFFHSDSSPPPNGCVWELKEEGSPCRCVLDYSGRTIGQPSINSIPIHREYLFPCLQHYLIFETISLHTMYLVMRTGFQFRLNSSMPLNNSPGCFFLIYS